jgi:hypothetical protein
MFDAFGSFGTNNNGGVTPQQGLLIPASMNDVVHVTAVDLHTSVAHAGPVWTKDGTVTLNATNPAVFPRRPSVGTFSGGNGFSLASPTPIDFTGFGPFTATVVLVNAGAPDNSIPVNVGTIASDGWSLVYFDQSGGQALFYWTSATCNTAPASWGAGTHVVTWGIDGSSNFIVGIDGVAGAPFVDGNINAPSAGANLGDPTGREFPGSIYEFAASTDPCTTSSITTIYNAVVANGATV